MSLEVKDIRQIFESIDPNIDVPEGILNMLTRDANTYQEGNNPAASMEAVETAVMDVFRYADGFDQAPTDINIEHVQRTLNLILSGADGSIAGVAAQNNGAFGQTAQEKAAKERSRASSDQLLRDAVNESIEQAAAGLAEAAGIPAATYNLLSRHVDENLSDEGQQAIDNIADDAEKGTDINEDDAKIAAEEIAESVEDLPEYQDLTDEQKRDFLKIKIAEATVAKMDDPGPDPQQTINDVLESLNELEDKNPEIFNALINSADKSILLDNAEKSATQLYQTTGMALATASLASNATAADFSDPAKISDAMGALIAAPTVENINQFILGLEKNITENANQGIALREAQEGLQAEIEILKNSPFASDGIIRTQIGLAEAQIEGMDKTFEELTNMNILTTEVKMFIENNIDIIVDNNNPSQIMAMALRDPGLKEAMDTVSGGIGSEKWQAGIEAVAQSLGFSEEYTAQYIEQQTAIAEKVTKLEESITYMEEFKAQIESDAAQGINNHFSPERAAEMIAEMGAEIETLENELYSNSIQDGLTSETSEAETSSLETPEGPEIDQTQAYLDSNPELKSYIQGLSETHGISQAAFASELEARGLTSDQAERVMTLAENNMGVNVSPKIDTAVNNTFNTLSAANIDSNAPATGSFNAAAVNPAPSTQSPAPQIMTPEEIELAAKADNVNNPAAPLNMSA